MARKKSPTFTQLKSEYQDLVDTMKIKRSWLSGFQRVANKIKKNRDRYEAISEDIARDHGNVIPWQFIGVIHNLECGLSFNKHLHNGDSLKKKTYRVPKGRPRQDQHPTPSRSQHGMP